MSKPYHVSGGDMAGPVPVGDYETFAEALRVRDETLKDAKARNYKLVLDICNSDLCDYATDTGWDDGLTEEERELL